MKSPISHLHFQEFDFSSYLAYKREGFVGRKWFFLELESIFEESRSSTAGVLITGEPGSGKSALMSQLICSPYSSLLIHENTIGYHLCEYSEKGKRDGARFVRNLVDQIAVRLPEYYEHVKNNEQMREELDTRCHKDPTGCFFTTIVGPLRKLKQPDSPRFIIIDALDECFESDTKTSEIMEILKSKILHFPKWLKVILTSRNLTSVTSRLPRVVNRTSLYATDERNVDDIRFYVKRFISQNSHFSDRLLAAMNISSRNEGMKIFLDEVITQAEGNFLFVKMTLQYMNDTGDKVDLHSLPTSLFDLYHIFFDRQFGAEGFKPFRFLFEVLLAVYSPLHSQHLEEILKSEYEAEDITKRIEQVSCFLRFGRDGTVRIYHQSFAEWLINQTPVLSINKTRGHQSIATFLLNFMREKHTDATFGELTELFMHILSGRSLEMQETAMNLFNVTEMREPDTNQSILHYLVTKPAIYLPVLDFFFKKFPTVDVLDSSNKTPAFYAASEGLVRSLQSCINNGADISSFLPGHTVLDPVSIVVRNTGIEEFSLMHVAVAKGHKDVVQLLIQSNISFSDSTKRYPTPLHLAVANGNLEMVKVFYDYGETFDQITLHHAAARNHLAVVRFILSTVGLRDTCVTCQPEHVSQLGLKTTTQEIHAFFCETALHTAVSRGLIDVVTILLNFGKESLECKHHSGKTVLMDAVERNNTEIVDLLLEHGANVTTDCGRKVSKDSNNQMCSIYAMYRQDFLYTVYCVNDSCGCGYRAIHMSAKYGLWKMAERLISGRIEEVIDIEDCDGDSATHVAIIYDHTHFVKNIIMSLDKIGRYLNESKIAKQAILHCSANVANSFLKHLIDEDESVWDLLLGRVKWSPCEAETVYDSYCLNAFKDDNLSAEEEMKEESGRRLNIIKLLIETHQQKAFILCKKDHHNRTLLHYAAANGFTDAVKYLVELGADKLLKDKNGDTPLTIALRNSPVYDVNHIASYRCYTTNDGQFSLCNTTCYDETVRYLVQSQRANISKCDNQSAFMLERVILGQMPLSLYALLKIGVEWNCRLNYFNTSAMLLHLQVGGREITEVIKMFEVDVSVKCEVSSSESELHELSYLSTADEFGNFFKPSLNKKRLPLQRLIDRHPRGVRILDECYDADGYLPIHRAVLGGNLVALKWFLSIGVNTQQKTRSGRIAIDLSILLLKNNKRIVLHSNMFSAFGRTDTRYRSECFEELLRAYFDTAHKNYSSDFSSFSFSEYPILHLAIMATKYGREVVTVVYKKALEIVPSLKMNKSLLLDEQNADGDTPLHIAAYLGRENVVKYLVRLGADVNIKNKNNHTPMLTALMKVPLHPIKSYGDHRCYITNDGLFSSCETTPHDEIVRYLIWSQKSSISQCNDESAYLLNAVILKRMPLSLYALLKIGVDVNCQLENELSPFQQHIREGGQEVGEVLNIFEVNVSVQCGVSFINSELHLISFAPVSNDFGNFFKPSLNKKPSPLQRLIDGHPRGVHLLDECYDAEGYLPIHRAAEGGNLVAIKWFKSIGVNTRLKTQSGFTALDISILHLKKNKLTLLNELHLDIFNTFGRMNIKYRNQCFEELLRSFFDRSHKNYSLDFSSFSFSKYPMLHLAIIATDYGREVVTVVYKRALKIIPGLKMNKSLLLDEQNADGDTPLHIAAYHGRENVVKYLVRLGADINIKNKNNHTPMFTALMQVSLFPIKSYGDHHCYITNDGLFKSCETTPHDEIVRYLIWSQKSSISKCDDESMYLLNVVIRKRMPLSLYALLKIGVDVNCQLEEELSSPVLQHIRKGGKEVSEVLKIFEVNVSAQCGVSLMFSELHLISYVSVSDDFGNFFKPSRDKKSSPLQRLIEHHPRGVRLLDECYDAEGYLPIHRAAQGGNHAAIKWFKRIGVNTHLKTRNGLTALDISILYLGDINYGELSAPPNIYLHLQNVYWHVPMTTSKYRKKVFEELLRTFLSTTSKSEFTCGPTLEGLSPLHIASVKGMAVLRYVHKKAMDILPNLPINCVNRHRLDPVYLAQFYDSVRNEGLIDKYSGENSNDVWYNLADEIIKHGKRKGENNIELEFDHGSVPVAQYPDREGDYVVAFNYLYHPPLRLSTERKRLFESGEKPESDCPGYYDIFPKYEDTKSFPDVADSMSKCLKLHHKDDMLLCINDHLFTYNCKLILNLLQLRYVRQRRRRNRKFSQFILKRLGWNSGSRVQNIDDRWPFYFLHKMHLKEFETYEYLKILNEALEVSDIRFYSHPLFDIIADP
ncbi:Ankyrin repeat domain-containing 50 [Paramuricea clavata]|uniref:Ankyrin repeat domain-containing 50 n=1 Tax=Paramuricea clavata TaxID=317549 RepID=A0A7D9DH16_PARCT|nr:Ankyrin repeat domain-containing 50 [Paramuricea clavata]